MKPSVVSLCSRLERDLPEYEFRSRWIVKYDGGDHEWTQGYRFRAMGSHRTLSDKSIFIHSRVSLSAGIKAALVPIRGSEDYYLQCNK